MWTIPFDTNAFTDLYRITWNGAISTLMIWPHYVMGITSAIFRGQLITARKTYNVSWGVDNILMAFYTHLVLLGRMQHPPRIRSARYLHHTLRR